MIEATEPTTKTPAAPPPTRRAMLDEPAAMPSVADLGRQLAMQWSAHDRFDTAETAAVRNIQDERFFTAEKARAWGNIISLGNLIMARPVETLADALVVALQGYCVADIELSSKDAETSELHQMRHAFAGIAVAIAKAEGMDLQTITFGADIDLMTVHAGAGGAV